jgi:hypothetical protein
MKTEESKLPINNRILLSTTLIGFFIVLLGSYLKITHDLATEPYLELILGLGVLIHFVSLIIVIYDLVRNPIRNKFMWFFGFLVLGSIAIILYLINRNALIRAYRYS